MALHTKIAAGLAGVILALLSLTWAAQAVFDADALGRHVQDQLRTEWQRDLQWRGLRLQILPAPAIKAQHLSLSNPDWASQPQLLQAQELTVSLQWLPLLRGELAVSGISAADVELALETDSRGRNTWDLPPSSQPRVNIKQIQHVDLAQLKIERRQPRAPPRQWNARKVLMQGEPGWKNVALNAELAANGQTMKLALKLADAAALGQANASSQGELRMDFENASLTLQGELPLNADLARYDARLKLQASSLKQAQAFFGWDGMLPTAALDLQASLKRQGNAHEFTQLVAQVGRQTMQASGRLFPGPDRWRLQARAQADRLDWAQAMRDLGRPAPPAKPEGELLPSRPFPWAALAGLQAVDASIDTSIGVLVTRTSLELQQLRTQVRVAESGITLADARFQLLGGSGSASLHMTPKRKEMQLQLQLQHVLLQDWFRRQAKRADMVSDGPLDLKADLRARGNSWKELGADLNGPLSIKVGALSVRSKKAREAEAMLVNLLPAFSEDKAEVVHVVCLASELRFVDGHARSTQAVGVRSQTSKLLLGGGIDLRRQSVDLAGRVRAADGVTLGISTVAGDVRIAGPLVRPQVSVEPVGTLARLGAAIATSGLSVLATAAYDAATAKADPCAIVGNTQAVKAKPVPHAPARTPDTR